MNDVNRILDNLGAEGMVKGSGITSSTILAPETPSINLDLSWLLKGPGIIILVVNLFFAVILFLRARILADTITTSQGRLVKSLVVFYLTATLIITLVSILFLILA